MLKISRRDFLKGSAVALSCHGLSPSDLALGVPTPTRRHLINIHGLSGPGGGAGWDSAWFHSPILESEAIRAIMDATHRNTYYYGGLAQFLEHSSNPNLFQRRQRFPDSDAISFAGGKYLGLGMRPFSNRDDLCIIRGLREVGGHRISNRITQTGAGSAYAASFSALIAQELAKQHLRPLHYVQTSANPAAFLSQTGLLLGPGVPINIKDAVDWQSLTEKDPNEIFVSTAHLDQTIEALSGLTQAFKLESSRLRYSQDFGVANKSLKDIRNTEYYKNEDFKNTIKGYKEAAIKYAKEVLYRNNARYDAIGHMFSLELDPAKSIVPVDISACGGNFLSKVAYGDTTNTDAALERAVFPFALADFLVVKNLSAVVDVVASLNDYHTHNYVDCMRMMVAMACYDKLIQRLKETNLFSNTLIVFSTDFDRQVAPTFDKENEPIGTNHAPSSSLILAGYRVPRNTVIGERTATMQPNLKDSSGEVCDVRSVLPTILKIFGIPIPPQQDVGAEVIPGVVA